jgi:hypothetical protein
MCSSTLEIYGNSYKQRNLQCSYGVHAWQARLRAQVISTPNDICTCMYIVREREYNVHVMLPRALHPTRPLTSFTVLQYVYGAAQPHQEPLPKVGPGWEVTP